MKLWRLTRAQLIDQVDGHIEPKTGLEELRACNVHVYDADRLADMVSRFRVRGGAAVAEAVPTVRPAPTPPPETIPWVTLAARENVVA